MQRAVRSIFGRQLFKHRFTACSCPAIRNSVTFAGMRQRDFRDAVTPTGSDTTLSTKLAAIFPAAAGMQATQVRSQTEDLLTGHARATAANERIRQ